MGLPLYSCIASINPKTINSLIYLGENLQLVR